MAHVRIASTFIISLKNDDGGNDAA